MNVQEVTLELSKGTVPGQIVRLGQGDIRGTTIRAVVYDGGAEVDLTGAQASFLIRLPDGRYYVRDANCTVSGNVITYVVDEAHCCLVSGYTNEAYFEFTKDGRTYSTSRFCVKIERAANDGAEIPPGSWDTAVDAAIDAANEAAELANAAATNAAATAAGIDSRISTAAHQAADEAASEVEGRVEAAIDAMGDISELAVPLMTSDTRGGAKLEAHGGLALRDGALGIGSLVQESDGYARGGLAEVTAKGHAEQDGTPTPENLVPIRVARGRNLLDVSGYANRTNNGIAYTNSSDGIIVSGTATSDSFNVSDFANVTNPSVLASGTYVLSFDNLGKSITVAVYGRSVGATSTTTLLSYGPSNRSFTLTESNEIVVIVKISSGVSANGNLCVQLELGSAPTPYVPYGHVGMEVRDPDTDELISCTPIPLPQRGWVAGLPDGTADSLKLDGAGKCEWELGTWMESLSGKSIASSNPTSHVFRFNGNFFAKISRKPLDNSLTVGVLSNRYIEKAYTPLSASDFGRFCVSVDLVFVFIDPRSSTNAEFLENNADVTLLYPLATPVTEDCGYVDMPAIPSDATVTIPELDALGIRYFVDDTVTQYGREIIARVRSEYEDRLTALEQAVAELATS